MEKVEEYDIAESDRDLRIKRFVEKPLVERAPSNLANAGIYLISPEVRKIVESREVKKIMEDRRRLDFGFDFITFLVNKDFPIYGHELNVWYDVGNPESYLKAMHDVLHGRLNIRVLEERILLNRNVWVQGFSEKSIKRRNEIVRKYKEIGCPLMALL